MAGISRQLAWRVLLLCVLVMAADSGRCRGVSAQGEEAKRMAARTSVGVTSKRLVHLLTEDLYDLLIRKGLLAGLDEAGSALYLERGRSVFHKIARAWHSVLVYKLQRVRVPSAWRSAAARAHERLGGRGSLLAALPSRGLRGRRNLNLHAGAVRREFLAHALFFLRAFVPEELESCNRRTEREAAVCIAPFKPALMAALFSTLANFLHFVAARYPSSRIVPSAFVIAALSPCPFRFLVESTFIYGVLRDCELDVLKRLAALRRIAGSKGCPAYKKQLLDVFMANGVTPADVMHAAGLHEDLTLTPSSGTDLVRAANIEVESAGVVDPRELLKKDGTDLADLETPQEVLETLRKFVEANAPKGQRDDDAESNVSFEDFLAAAEPAEAEAYLDRVRTFLDGAFSELLDLPAGSLQDLVRQEAAALEAEALENPQKTGLKPTKEASRKQQAAEVLQQMRRFPFQVPSSEETQGKR